MNDQPILTLSDYWLRDQTIAFAATLLGEVNDEFEPLSVACAEVLMKHIEVFRSGLVSDSTLRLATTVDENLFNEDFLETQGLETLPGIMSRLAETVAEAQKELDGRDAISGRGLNRVLISHAVYLLKRRNLSAVQFLTWLHRAASGAVPGMEKVLKAIKAPEGDHIAGIENSLAGSRDSDRQTRYRLDEIDKLYALVLDASGDSRDKVHPWWTRICMAYRSSLFCWPLLAEKREKQAGQDENGHNRSRGLSLPISLFLVDDGKSTFRPTPNNRGQKIWFKYKLTKAEEDEGKREPHFQPGGDGFPAHMDGYYFGFTPEWWDAFGIGVDVAKKLWSSQNGRLRYADDEVAQSKLRSSLNVDLRAACDIVEAVYSGVDDDVWLGETANKPDARFFIVEDRSAEAYWVQCVLGLLLPAHEVPMGLCTGKIEYNDGDFEMQDVGDVVEKLEYANRAGVPRVVIPGDRREFYDDSEEEGARVDVKAFLDRIAESDARKTLEVNFSRTARAAADAMQPSGWRRANFLRTATFQRAFGYHQRRLFLRDSLLDTGLKKRLKRDEIDWYLNHRKWSDVETKQLEWLDRILLSDADRSVKYVSAEALGGKVPGLSAEETVGKWVAWKDNQVRSGAETGYRGPGLGVLAMRTAEGDHEVRLWAALAEMLDASVDWWEEFQWSNLPQAAEKLAELLSNQRANPLVSEGSAPDLVVIFDDARITQHRTNVVFPNNFHHQFYDLLNPRHPGNHKSDYLDDALKRHGTGALGHPTRIIIVLGAGDEDQTSGVIEMEPDDRDFLERIGLFRFGCSRQAAYAMANYGREPDERISWNGFEIAVDRLIAAKLLARSRNTLYLSPAVRQALGEISLNDDPAAHQRAAEALSPILNPRRVRIAGNRDRQLEPENVLEANWHLQRAFSLVPNRFRKWGAGNSGQPTVSDSQALLTLLRTSPDWDTVKKMRVNSQTRHESVELCDELFSAQMARTGHPPRSTTIALHVETLGRLYKNEQQAEDRIEDLANDVSARVENAVADLKTEYFGEIEWKRRLRHLFSRQIYTLRMLGLPFSDERMRGAMAYIQKASQEILQRDFIENLGDDLEGLNDFPISYDCWRCLWSDGKNEQSPNKTLSLAERSSFAFAAAKSNIARNRGGRKIGAPWDEPWVAYFILTRPEDIAPAQLAGPLMTWSDVYGTSDEAASEFGQRVLDLQQHARPPRNARQKWKEMHGRNVVKACTNLWKYVTHPDPELRLTGAPVGSALKLIKVMALPESLPAFGLIHACEPIWLKHWPAIAMVEDPQRWPDPANQTHGFVADEWRDLARRIIGHNSGWIAMLESLDGLPNDEERLQLVTSWLHAFNELKLETLHHADPEKLLYYADSLPSVKKTKATAVRGKNNADAVFAQRNDRGNALWGHYRKMLSELKRSLRY